LNPFRTSVNTSNEVLGMQGITIGILLHQGLGPGEPPLSPVAAEEEYQRALTRHNGEQYELVPPAERTMAAYMQPNPLYTLRHVLRTNPSNVKVLGIYYVVEGVIYKSPSVLSVMKTNITRILEGIGGACQTLSVCARYQPSFGYMWVFEQDTKGDLPDDETIDEGEQGEGPPSKKRTVEDVTDTVKLIRLAKRRKRRKVIDHRRLGERTPAEEEGIRASEAIDQILVRLSRSPLVVGPPPTRTAKRPP
jgi:MED6 mediator sub complex component